MYCTVQFLFIFIFLQIGSKIIFLCILFFRTLLEAHIRQKSIQISYTITIFSEEKRKALQFCFDNGNFEKCVKNDTFFRHTALLMWLMTVILIPCIQKRKRTKRKKYLQWGWGSQKICNFNMYFEHGFQIFLVAKKIYLGQCSVFC